MIAQYDLCSQLVVMKHHTFHRLAEKCQINAKHVIVMHMIQRSGSTLLCQMFGKLPNTIAYSEPYMFKYLLYFRSKGLMSKEKAEKLALDYIKLLCKKRLKQDDETIFFKASFATYYIEAISQKLPWIKQFAIVRHPKACIKSQYQMWRYDSILRLFRRFQRTPYFQTCIPFDFEDEKLQQVKKERLARRKEEGYVEDSTYYYAGPLDMILKGKDLFLTVIHYEDLREDPERVLFDLFSLCQLENARTLTPIALAAKEAHSQVRPFTLFSPFPFAIFRATSWGLSGKRRTSRCKRRISCKSIAYSSKWGWEIFARACPGRISSDTAGISDTTTVRLRHACHRVVTLASRRGGKPLFPRPNLLLALMNDLHPSSPFPLLSSSLLLA